MEQQFMEAAREGNIADLYALIREDQNVLEEMDKILFVETPLHVAASQGQTHFALEMMELKPSFARKWNHDRFTPMYLAIQCGQTEITLRLLSVQGDNGDIVRVKGHGGLTPLHCAAEQGNIELLLRFLSTCPKSIEGVTIQNETCLHLALKNDQFEAFKALIGWIELGYEEGAFWEETILNWKNDQGKTVLDLETWRQEVHSLISGRRLARYVNIPAQKSNCPISYLNEYAHLLSTGKRLNKAAYDGDTDSLYAILKEDQHILERIDQVPFVDTPLHVAASEGHYKFTKAIMKLKPSFARKLNQDGFSPMHVAVQNQQKKIAIMLLDMNKELVTVGGKNGWTPFHCAAEMGNCEFLRKFLEAQPESIKDLTVGDESALHVAVKHNKLDSLEFLYKWILNRGLINILRWPDHEGNIARDIAEGNTVRDIAEDQMSNHLQIRAFLRKQGAAFNIVERVISSYATRTAAFRSHEGASQEDVNMVLVVYTLIASSAYQTLVTPPGGDHFFYSLSSGINDKDLPFPVRMVFSFLFLNLIMFFYSVLQLLSYIPKRIALARLMLIEWAFCHVTVMIYNFCLKTKLN